MSCLKEIEIIKAVASKMGCSNLLSQKEIEKTIYASHLWIDAFNLYKEKKTDDEIYREIQQNYTVSGLYLKEVVVKALHNLPIWKNDRELTVPEDKAREIIHILSAKITLPKTISVHKLSNSYSKTYKRLATFDIGMLNLLNSYYKYKHDESTRNKISSKIEKLIYKQSKIDYKLNNESETRAKRILVFVKNKSCVSCGAEAKFVAFEENLKTDNSPNNPKYILNIYAVTKEGHQVMLTQDHIIPRSIGGKSGLYNLQTMCERCNLQKGNKIEIS